MPATFKRIQRRITLGANTHTIRLLRDPNGNLFFSIDDVASAVGRSLARATAFVLNNAHLGWTEDVNDTLFVDPVLLTRYLRSVHRLTDAVTAALRLDELLDAGTRKELLNVLRTVGFSSDDYHNISSALYLKVLEIKDTDAERAKRGLRPKASLRAALTPSEMAQLRAVEHGLAQAVQSRVESGETVTALKVRRTLTSLMETN